MRTMLEEAEESADQLFILDEQKEPEFAKQLETWLNEKVKQIEETFEQLSLNQLEEDVKPIDDIPPLTSEQVEKIYDYISDRDETTVNFLTF